MCETLLFDKMDGFTLVDFNKKEVPVNVNPGCHKVILLKRNADTKASYKYRANLKVSSSKGNTGNNASPAKSNMMSVL